MIKSMLFVCLVMGCIQQANAGVLQVSSQKIALQEFQLDVSDTAIGRKIRCSDLEVTRGMWGQVSTKNQNRNFRPLIPSYRPLNGEAAWYISNSVCHSLGQFTNGIGFEYYDPKSGEGIVYLAHFVETDYKRVEAKNRIDRDFSYQPDFVAMNVVVIPVKCEISNSSWSLSDVNMICYPKDRSGQIIFKVQSTSN